jgi:hypothetical protein
MIFIYMQKFIGFQNSQKPINFDHGVSTQPYKNADIFGAFQRQLDNNADILCRIAETLESSVSQSNVSYSPSSLRKSFKDSLSPYSYL